jgi:hypothetical protein
MLAKTAANIASNKDSGFLLPTGMQDSKSSSEFYSEMMTYGPSILREAARKGDPFHRFKLVVKFAFSILHNLTVCDVFTKRPLVPIVGETYEAHYIVNETSNLFMEADYTEYDV